jgi:DNA repair exonuclease SbcCD ATPase subunit
MDLNLPDEPGFFLVQGKNGNGKSTLSDVIKFALYGKLENKKLKDMANRMNKHAEIKISLSTRKGTVVVERGVEPGYFRLFLNGKQIDKAGKRSVQEYLEEELLEMPFYVFSNTLSLSINDFKSFIRMSNFDKRAIIDKIFGLQVLNQMREVLKTQNKKLKEAVENLNSSVSAYTRSLETAHNELEKLQSKIQESQGEKLKDLEERLTKLEDFIKKATSREDKIESKKLEAEKLKKAVETSISGDSQLVREAKQKISLYENSKCPTCASDLTTDFHKDTLKQYQDSMDEAKKRIEEKYEKQDKIIKAVDDLREKLRESQRQITSAETQYEQVEREIKSLKKENVSDESSSLLRIVEEAKKNIRINKQEKAKTENKMSFFSLIEEILGEKGIKQLAIRSILPSLNTEIQRLVKTLGLEHRIVFDEEFNAKLSHFGVDVSADTLSTGESKKVDFAVLLAIIRLLKMKYPGVNILFLDEIFSSVDGDGIYQILKILRDTVKEYNMNIFVISHYPLSYTEFDYTLEIKKSNGFSSFTVEKVS